MPFDKPAHQQQDIPTAPVLGCYEIRVRGELDPSWSSWLGGLDVHTTRRGDTVVSGPIVDQAALHGLLERIRDMGLELLGVRRLDVRPRRPTGSG
jgi:hypothetical protein